MHIKHTNTHIFNNIQRYVSEYKQNKRKKRKNEAKKLHFATSKTAKNATSIKFFSFITAYNATQYKIVVRKM